MAKAHLVLLRTPSTPLHSDAYSALTPLVQSLTYLPVLSTQLLPSALSSILSDPSPPGSRYSGVIITSARAVRAWERAATGRGGGKGWQQLPFFVVGQPTAEALLGMEDCPTRRERVLGAESGTGDKLARYIRRHVASAEQEQEGEQEQKQKQKQKQKPLLYLVGDKNKETITEILLADEGGEKGEGEGEGEGGIRTERVQVYETEVVDSFGEDLQRALQGIACTASASEPTATEPPTTVYLALFSPSGCLPLLTHLRRLSLLPPSPSSLPPAPPPPSLSSPPPNLNLNLKSLNLKFLAIGPVTHGYLVNEQGIEEGRVVVADRPEAEGVGRALERELGLEREWGRVGGGASSERGQE
ncbi:tetrapyrrole biosynthesis, uroporphyrinogen III synthase [Leucosporidium creatinivorum]|uniref:Tetrapyrrole biosynthesis, uroporphyrinogen III synthase n=1 Tax=Leucosporidium creatinivorum TaxID=106004 RepID=A0A1Y2EMV7_9BASI|nr:tetrapyrrole biosynthesis, uroporphyrinogen III synthase [Leucosporidium creatinivorum]